MALGDERRAIGRANEAARRQLGRDNERNRRAIGTAMETERRGSDIVSDLQALSGPQRTRRTLSPVAPVGALPAQRGRGTYTPPATGGGCIASPLNEADISAREYWPAGLPSSDGLFMMPAIRTLSLVDASGASVVVQLADPGAA